MPSTERQRWIAWGSCVALAGLLIVLSHTLFTRLPAIPE